MRARRWAPWWRGHRPDYRNVGLAMGVLSDRRRWTPLDGGLGEDLLHAGGVEERRRRNSLAQTSNYPGSYWSSVGEIPRATPPGISICSGFLSICTTCVASIQKQYHALRGFHMQVRASEALPVDGFRAICFVGGLR